MISRTTRDRIAAGLYACLVAVTALTVIWSMRQGWAVYKLRRGVGDTWFYAADGRAWFRMDEQRRDVGLDQISPDLRNAVIAVVLLSSMYGFVAPDAKTEDHFFTGFPSYWNIVVLYLLLFRVSPEANAAILLGLSALVFVRIGWIYPSRTATLQGLTLALGALWTVAIAAIILRWPSPPRWIAIASLGFPVYYIVLSLVLHSRRAPR